MKGILYAVLSLLNKTSWSRANVFFDIAKEKKMRQIENRLCLSNITNETTVMSVLIKL